MTSKAFQQASTSHVQESGVSACGSTPTTCGAQMQIRPMTDGDIGAVVDLALANYDGVMAEHHTAEVLAGFRADITPEFFREQMGWKQVFVVEQAGEVIATGALADFGTPHEPRYTVSQFYVRLDLHRRGIGAGLLDQFVAMARDVGADSLHVPSSRNAIPFYRHHGFSIDAPQPDAALEITWMTKPLREPSAEQANWTDGPRGHEDVHRTTGLQLIRRALGRVVAVGSISLRNGR
jgi:GNAT superfamily N-acetyltransferase